VEGKRAKLGGSLRSSAQRLLRGKTEGRLAISGLLRTLRVFPETFVHGGTLGNQKVWSAPARFWILQTEQEGSEKLIRAIEILDCTFLASRGYRF
jgi:hypothetical protein